MRILAGGAHLPGLALWLRRPPPTKRSAEEAGLTATASIYLYFESKTALYMRRQCAPACNEGYLPHYRAALSRRASLRGGISLMVLAASGAAAP